MMVVDGAEVWRLHAQDGYPVEFSLAGLADRNAVPSWGPLFAAARADGANLRRLADRLILAVRDAYPKEVADILAVGLSVMPVYAEKRGAA